MNDITTDQLSQLASAPAEARARSSSTDRSSWFEAFARAWGASLDRKADEIVALSESIGVDGNDRASTLTQLTATSLEFGFLSQSQNSSMNSVGEGLQTMARKQ